MAGEAAFAPDPSRREEPSLKSDAEQPALKIPPAEKDLQTAKAPQPEPQAVTPPIPAPDPFQNKQLSPMPKNEALENPSSKLAVQEPVRAQPASKQQEEIAPKTSPEHALSFPARPEPRKEPAPIIVVEAPKPEPALVAKVEVRIAVFATEIAEKDKPLLKQNALNEKPAKELSQREESKLTPQIAKERDSSKPTEIAKQENPKQERIPLAEQKLSEQRTPPEQRLAPVSERVPSDRTPQEGQKVPVSDRTAVVTSATQPVPDSPKQEPTTRTAPANPAEISPQRPESASPRASTSSTIEKASSSQPTERPHTEQQPRAEQQPRVEQRSEGATHRSTSEAPAASPTHAATRQSPEVAQVSHRSQPPSSPGETIQKSASVPQQASWQTSRVERVAPPSTRQSSQRSIPQTSPSPRPAPRATEAHSASPSKSAVPSSNAGRVTTRISTGPSPSPQAVAHPAHRAEGPRTLQQPVMAPRGSTQQPTTNAAIRGIPGRSVSTASSSKGSVTVRHTVGVPRNNLERSVGTQSLATRIFREVRAALRPQRPIGVRERILDRLRTAEGTPVEKVVRDVARVVKNIFQPLAADDDIAPKLKLENDIEEPSVKKPSTTYEKDVLAYEELETENEVRVDSELDKSAPQTELLNADEVTAAHTIRGTVFENDTGKPLAGVLIRGGSLGTAESDPFGAFKFENITEGTRYVLIADSPGIRFSPAFASGAVSGDVVVNFRGTRPQA